MSHEFTDDIFLVNGMLRTDLLEAPLALALQESLHFTQTTNWDSVRTPHLFMGLLATPDQGVTTWMERLGTSRQQLLDQFRLLFTQDTGPQPPLRLHREFLSDNVLRLLRDAWDRAGACGRTQVSQLDLLITTFNTPNSIVAECFERIGLNPGHLAELAEQAEQEVIG